MNMVRRLMEYIINAAYKKYIFLESKRHILILKEQLNLNYYDKNMFSHLNHINI